jgi:hypothetical protein
MTRKDFERIAQVFRVAYNKPGYTSDRTATWDALDAMLDDMCVELKAINPRFDEDKFRKACEPNG